MPTLCVSPVPRPPHPPLLPPARAPSWPPARAPSLSHTHTCSGERLDEMPGDVKKKPTSGKGAPDADGAWRSAARGAQRGKQARTRGSHSSDDTLLDAAGEDGVRRQRHTDSPGDAEGVSVQEARVTQRHAKMTKAEREEYKVLRMKAQEGERAVGPWAGLLLCTGLREPAATHPCVISTRFVCVCLCVCVCVCIARVPLAAAASESVSVRCNYAAPGKRRHAPNTYTLSLPLSHISPPSLFCLSRALSLSLYRRSSPVKSPLPCRIACRPPAQGGCPWTRCRPWSRRRYRK